MLFFRGLGILCHDLVQRMSYRCFILNNQLLYYNAMKKDQNEIIICIRNFAQPIILIISEWDGKCFTIGYFP